MKSFSDFGKQLEEAKATYTIKDSEGNLKYAGTDKDTAYKTHKFLNTKKSGHKLYKNGVSCLAESLCQVCGEVDCKEHFYKSPAVTGYVKEETGEHHDYEHVKKTMKKVDYDAYVKHTNKNDADYSMENKHKVDTQHSGSFTGKIHGAEVSHKVSGSGQKEYYIKESRGHKILATAMANAERMKTVQIPTPAERRAELEKQNKEKQMKEATEKKPYIVISHVSDNTGTRADGEKVEKNRVATKLIATSPEHALQLSKAHHEKSGRKVHSASIKEDISVDEAVDHQHRIARDTVKNPNKSLLGGPSAKEAEETLRKKYGYDDKKIAKLKEDVDMGQADRTLRSKEKSKNTYHVKDSSGKIISTHDNHSDAMRGAMKQDDHKVVKEAVDTVKKDASGKVIAWSHEGDWQKNSTKNKQGTGKAANLAGKALQQTKKLTKEEKDQREYGYEGDMAITQLKTICRHAEHLMGMLKPDTDLPEWVQSKITLATDYIQTTHDYLMSEMNESLDEGLFDNMPNTKAGFAYKDKKRSERHAEHEKQDPKMAVHYAKNMVDTAKAAKKAKERGITKHADDFGWQVRNGVQRGKLPEEVELEEGWEVFDTKTRAIHSSHPTQRKALNHMNKLNDKHPGYETPGNLIASKFGARVSGLKEDLDESAWGNDKMTNLRQAHDRHMEKALAANKAGDDQAVKTHQRKMQMIQGKLQKLKNNEEVDLGEECEILFELSDLDEGRMTELSDDLANMSHTEFHKTYGKPKHHFDPTNFKKPVQAGGGMDRARALAQRGMQSVLAKEDYIDELSKSTLASYIGGAAGDLPRLGNTLGRLQTHGKLPNVEKSISKTIRNRYHGINKAADKLTKEEIEELGESTYGQDQYKKYPDMKKHFDLVGVNRADYELSNMKKAHQFTSWDPSSKQMIASINAIQKHKRSISAGQHLEDYSLEEIQDFMMSENFEQLDELSKATLSNYLKKARVSALKHHMVADLRQQGADYSGAAQYRAIANKRAAGYKQALTKLNKEGTVVTYKEFMASIEEGRIDDLRDKMAADREKRLNKMDYSKEKEAKKNPITKVRGHSYGAGDEDGEADPVKAAEPAEKRGRGRPAGSKSGARA